MSRRAFRVLVLVLPVVAALASACGTPTEPTDTTPPSPTAGLVPVTETFSGTLVSGGSNVHTFHTMQGLLKVTLDSLDPTDAPLIGVGIGMWDGLSCQLVLSTSSAQGAELPGTAAFETHVCIKVWDPATLAEDGSLKYQLPEGTSLKYQVTAVHNEKPSS
jgi:hypothetical protein